MKKSNALYVHSKMNSNPQNHNYVKKLEKFLESEIMQNETNETVYIEVSHPNVSHIKLDTKTILENKKVICVNIYHQDNCHIHKNGWCTCDPDIQIK